MVVKKRKQKRSLKQGLRNANRSAAKTLTSKTSAKRSPQLKEKGVSLVCRTSQNWFCKNCRTLVFSLGLALIIVFLIQNPDSLTVGKVTWLFCIGALVGLLDVKREEQNAFILAALAIIFATSVPFQNLPYFGLGRYIKAFLFNSALFLTPALVIVGLKILYRIFQETRDI